MGVYVYVVRKSKPILKVSDLNAPLYRMVYATRASVLEEGVFGDRCAFMRRNRHYAKLSLNSSINAWDAGKPQYIVLCGKEENGLFDVYANIRSVCWYDSDSLPGDHCGHLFIKDGRKQFISDENFVAMYAEATGENWTGHARRGVAITPGTYSAEVVAAYYKAYCLTYSISNTVAARCPEKMADCL